MKENHLGTGWELRDRASEVVVLDIAVRGKVGGWGEGGGDMGQRQSRNEREGEIERRGQGRVWVPHCGKTEQSGVSRRE